MKNEELKNNLLEKRKSLQNELNEINEQLYEYEIDSKANVLDKLNSTEFNTIRSKMEKLNKGIKEVAKIHIDIEVEKNIKLGYYEVEDETDHIIDIDGMSEYFNIKVTNCSSKQFSNRDCIYTKKYIQEMLDSEDGDLLFDNFDIFKKSSLKEKYQKELDNIINSIQKLADNKNVNKEELTDILVCYNSLNEARKNYR